MPTLDELIDCSIEGRQARREGKLLTDNPYPIGSGFYNVWKKYWEIKDNLIKYEFLTKQG